MERLDTLTGPRRAAALLPGAPGVYRFRDERGQVLYVGRAVDLRRRVASYWGALRDRRHLRRMVPRIARVEAVVCDSAHEAAWLERNLLEQRKPYWNRTRGGAEVPVWIRLDPGARTARLVIIHEQGVHEERVSGGGQLFGPYLGGLKVRLAVSALDRVLPMAYAADGLAGFARDLARMRGIAATDRSALAEAVTALLRGDVSTVGATRSELARRRDAAAGALAFELAGRIQDEIEALDWITAEQKVTLSTVDGPVVDAEVHGWADGRLVRFEIRAGRLRTWTQRECPQSTARPLLQATPAGWTAFAQRSATLAARLTAAG